jgi:hypothetical protein
VVSKTRQHLNNEGRGPTGGLTVRLGDTHHTESVSQACIGIEVLSVQWCHGEVDELELEVTFVCSKHLIPKHVRREAR